MNSPLPMHPRHVRPVMSVNGHKVKRPARQHPNPPHIIQLKKAQAFLQRDEHGQTTCATCWEVESPNKPLEAHHRHYDNWGSEKLSDIVLICPDCHDAITQRYTDKRLSIAEEAIREYFFPGKEHVH